MDKQCSFSPVVIRNLVFLVVLLVAITAYAGPPLVNVFPDQDFELTYGDPSLGGFIGRPIADADGYGTCTITLSGRLVVDMFVYAADACPNMAVANEATVNGFPGQNCLLGFIHGTCWDNGLARANGAFASCCDGTDPPPLKFDFPDRCFQPPNIHRPTSAWRGWYSSLQPSTGLSMLSGPCNMRVCGQLKHRANVQPQPNHH